MTQRVTGIRRYVVRAIDSVLDPVGIGIRLSQSGLRVGWCRNRAETGEMGWVGFPSE